MPNISNIYDPWGGNAEAMAADIGVPGVTARQWRNRRSIPPRYWQAIISAAERRGHRLAIEAFVAITTEAAA